MDLLTEKHECEKYEGVYHGWRQFNSGYQQFTSVDDPENYPEKCVDDECRNCINAERFFFKSSYNQYQTTFCKPGKVHVCIEGFIHPKEMRL